MRDVRRLIVSTSRSRLGIYIFGRQKLFETCYELKPTFDQLLSRPTDLFIIKNENYNEINSKREFDDCIEVNGLKHMDTIVDKMTQDWQTNC